MANLLERIDTYEKWLKVLRAATQALWVAVLDVRTDTKSKYEIEPIAAILIDILELGHERHYPVPEMDHWWNSEVLEAYKKID